MHQGVEEELFGKPETGTSICIADGESLWCSVVLFGFSVGSHRLRVWFHTADKQHSEQTGNSQQS